MHTWTSFPRMLNSAMYTEFSLLKSLSSGFFMRCASMVTFFLLSLSIFNLTRFGRSNLMQIPPKTFCDDGDGNDDNCCSGGENDDDDAIFTSTCAAASIHCCASCLRVGNETIEDKTSSRLLRSCSSLAIFMATLRE